jgi:hypothetical protein
VEGYETFPPFAFKETAGEIVQEPSEGEGVVAEKITPG